jgi:hypothetical protein
MAKDTPEKPEGDASDKVRRKPPTIDLSAAEVARKAADPTGAGPAADAGARPERERPGEEPAGSSAGGVPGSRDPHDRPDAPTFVPLIIAALLGGVIVALVVVLLARAGYLLPAQPEGPDLGAEIASLRSDVDSLRSAAAEDTLAPVRAEVEALRKSVGELAAREPEAVSDPALQSGLSDLEQRVAALADEVAARPSGSGEPSAAAGDIAALRKSVDELAQRIDGLPGETRISALETKAAAAQNARETLQASLDRLAETAERSAALGPAVAADALAAALGSGRPFEGELAALRTLDADAGVLDGLAPHAASGLPTLSSLRARFETAIASVDLATPIPEGSGVVDRLVQSARGLVTVRPAHPTEGSDPSAVVTRIRGALDAGDLGTALAEWESLPAAVKEATAEWAEEARVRRDADALVARLRAEALAALKAGR